MAETRPVVQTAGASVPATPTYDAASARDSAGTWFNPDVLPQTYGYDGAGNLTAITVTDGVSTWVQTLTYTNGNLTAVGQWVKQ